MNAFEITIILNILIFSSTVITWFVSQKLIKIRITEPYLSGESESEYKLSIHDPSISFKKWLKRLYENIYTYIQTGYWGDWFVLSLPYLLILLFIIISTYFRGG